MSDNNNTSAPTHADHATCPTCGRPISATPAASGISASGPVGPGNGSSLAISALGTEIARLRPNCEASLEATVASVGPTREVDTSRGPAEVADTGPVLRTPSALPGLR